MHKTRKLVCLCFVVICVLVVVLLWPSSDQSVDYAEQPREGRPVVSLKEVIGRKRNVLMVIADDLRPQLSVYHGHGMKESIYGGMHTPHLDALAAESLLFEKAFAQYTVCGPSRASALTSRRPSTTKVYNLKDYFRKRGGNFTTLPQYFKEHGYSTKGVGKVFHHGRSSGQDNDAISWTHPFFQPPYNKWHNRARSWQAVTEDQRKAMPLIDDIVYAEALASMKALSSDYRQNQQHFFLAVGFYRPHLPFVFPEEFLKYYPLDTMDTPSSKELPTNFPDVARNDFVELAGYEDISSLNLTGRETDKMPYTKGLSLRRAYYASVSYVDSLVGRLLRALEAESIAEDTIVAFWGDHGFLLGEHGEWCKHSVFELATRIPMMIRIPGVTDHGLVTDKVVELLDLYPTLAEAAGLPPLPDCPRQSTEVATCTEGKSMVPLFADPADPTWSKMAFTEQARMNLDPGVIGQSVRTEKYRYTEWPVKARNLQWDDLRGVELYDLKEDPLEDNNIASESEVAEIRETLSLALRSKAPQKQ